MFDTAADPDLLESGGDIFVGGGAGMLSEETGHPSTSSELDRRVADAVARALRSKGLPALRDVAVDVARGVVVLAGRVPSFYQKQLAQVTAEKVGGVSRICNALEVVAGPARVPGR